MANEKRLIDAKSLMDRLRKRREDFASAWRTFDAMPIDAQIQYHENLECSLIVEDHPIVDAVEVIHAYWMYADELDESGDLQAYCSNCMAFDLHAPRKKNDVPYCWRCGAKMDGGADENGKRKTAD